MNFFNLSISCFNWKANASCAILIPKFSADGTRSIRFGNHEMNSMNTTKFHFHQEEWKYDSANDVIEYFNTPIRIKK